MQLHPLSMGWQKLAALGSKNMAFISLSSKLKSDSNGLDGMLSINKSALFGRFLDGQNPCTAGTSFLESHVSKISPSLQTSFWW